MSRSRMITVGKKRFKIVVTKLNASKESEKIPTTFVPLCPEKIQFEDGSADMLCGLFHIMWADMPRPASYALKLSDLFSISGEYLGSKLECSHPKRVSFACAV